MLRLLHLYISAFPSSVSSLLLLHVHHVGCHDGLVPRLNSIGRHGRGSWGYCRLAVLRSDWVGNRTIGHNFIDGSHFIYSGFATAVTDAIH